MPLEGINKTDVGSSTFENAAPGKHYVTGVAFKGSGGNPASFTVRNGTLSVLTEFITTSKGSANPVMTCTPAEVLSLLVAFQVKVPAGIAKRPTSWFHDDATFLPLIEEKICSAGNTVSVTVGNKGWVQSIEGAQPPVGNYTLKFIGTWDQKYVWQVGQWGKYLRLLFEIVGDANGAPCIWNGFRVQWMLNEFSEPQMVDEDGNPFYGESFAWKRHEKGGILPEAFRVFKFIEYFCPEIAEHEWQHDALEYGVNEYEQPQQVIFPASVGRTAVVPLTVAAKSGKIYPDINNIDSAYLVDDDDDYEEEPVVEEEDVAPISESILPVLIDYLTDLAKAKDIKVFEMTTPNVIFTTPGASWMKEMVSGAWERAQLPEKRDLASLSNEQIERLMSELHAQFDVDESGW